VDEVDNVVDVAKFDNVDDVVDEVDIFGTHT